MLVVLRVSRWHCHVSHGGADGQEVGSEGANVADRSEIMCLPSRPAERRNIQSSGLLQPAC